ncbi:MAG: hypothetical protein PHD82_07340 [Candidatus Riflebacteria bacterium]|nr:hypothetical protein [Candidatus Riflebacteria bacterium]
MAVLLGLAILAFGLNTFKQGAITQLARNVDQNRLALLAQSANAEVIAMIRSLVNSDRAHPIYQRFRDIFPDNGPAAALNVDIPLFLGFEPQQTLQMAQNAGYPLKVKSKAVLRIYRKCEYNSVSAYNGYIDIYSQAYRDGFKETSIEVYERRDVRLVDLRHNLDKYALFVKNYSPDYNNTYRRVIVEGIKPSGPNISRVYLGNSNYPDCLDTQKNIWLDLCYQEQQKAPGILDLFNFSGLKKFPDGSGTTSLFSFASTGFTSLKDSQGRALYEDRISDFVDVVAVKKIYENFVNNAADGIRKAKNKPKTAYKTGDALKTKCSQAIPLSNDKAASFQICQDFVANANGTNYSACSGFQKILRTCMANWKLHHGYLDAANVWQVDTAQRPALPNAQPWATALSYRGLTELATENNKKGPYFYNYLNKIPDKPDKPGGKTYNPERLRVGKMLQLYGSTDFTPVLVEGPVFLRFFKIAYFDTFVATITFFDEDESVVPEPVPVNFIRPTIEPQTFQNLPLQNEFSPSAYFSDNLIMSRAIDNVSVNALLGSALQTRDGEGKLVTINPLTAPRPTFPYPRQRPSPTPVTANSFGRLIDFKTVSYNYSSPAEFLAERKGTIGSDEVLFLDGVIYIEAGDLDLGDIDKFYGKGMIYLGRGNCYLGDLLRYRSPQSGDSLRLYLRKGDFILKRSEQTTIEASLAAFYNPPGSADPSEQGSLIFNGQKTVTIIGNLLVDYLYTQERGDNSLSEGGRLIIRHDPFLYEPAAEVDGVKMDPFQISIGTVKTAFAINSGGKTF